jgi:hypothetical protein
MSSAGLPASADGTVCRVRDIDPTPQGDPPEELHLAALLDVIDDSNLKPHLKRTLGVLARYGNWKTGTNIRPSLKTVALRLEKSRRAVNYDIEDLLRIGVLETEGAVRSVRGKTAMVMTARRGGKERPTEFKLNLPRLRELSRFGPAGPQKAGRAPQPTSEGQRSSPATETLKCSAQTLKYSAANLEVGFNRSSGSNVIQGRTRAAAAPQLELVPEPDADAHYAVITAVVTKDILPRRLPDEQLLAATITRCEKLGIRPCNPDVARKAVESALFRYYREMRQEYDLPADPRGIYHDHELPVAIGLPLPMPVKRRQKRRSNDKRTKTPRAP